MLRIINTSFRTLAILKQGKYYEEQGDYEKMENWYLMTLDYQDTIGLETLIEFYNSNNNIVRSYYYTHMLDGIKKNN